MQPPSIHKSENEQIISFGMPNRLLETEEAIVEGRRSAESCDESQEGKYANSQ